VSDRKHGEREAAAPARRKRHRLSPLTWRILAINIAALLIPVASLLYLGPYRDGLIESELESLRTQGETFAGAIGEGAIEITTSGRQLINLPIARQIVWRLSAPTGIRARLFVPSGELIGDSRYLMGTRQAVQIQELPPPTGEWTLDSMGFLIDWCMNWMPTGEPSNPIRKNGVKAPAITPRWSMRSRGTPMAWFGKTRRAVSYCPWRCPCNAIDRSSAR